MFAAPSGAKIAKLEDEPFIVQRMYNWDGVASILTLLTAIIGLVLGFVASWRPRPIVGSREDVKEGVEVANPASPADEGAVSLVESVAPRLNVDIPNGSILHSDSSQTYVDYDRLSTSSELPHPTSHGSYFRRSFIIFVLHLQKVITSWNPG